MLSCCSGERALVNEDYEPQEYPASNILPPPHASSSGTAGIISPLALENSTASTSAGVTTPSSPSLTWLDDSEAPFCFHCSNKFSASRRKHHCRRCCERHTFLSLLISSSSSLGNVFCSKCSDHKAILPSSSSSSSSNKKNERVRVCVNCLNEINQEVAYLHETLPILRRGETFKTKSLMGLSIKFIILRLMADGKHLLYEENNNSEPILIPLSNIDNIIPSSFISFDILTTSPPTSPSSGSKSVTYSFEAENKALQQLWILSLKQLLEYHEKQLNFAKNNEILRQRKKLEMQNQLEREEEAAAVAAAASAGAGAGNGAGVEVNQREQRKLTRDQIREKYGLNK
jgi:type II secretory pathway pseudopilin PulG